MPDDEFGKATRRGFLGTVTAAGAATLTSPAASAAPAGAAAPPGATVTAQWTPPYNDAQTSGAQTPKVDDWSKPAALALPKEGYFQLEQGRYGPVYPKTPANYGFTIIAKIKPGREETIRAYGK